MISSFHHKIRNKTPLLHKIREKGYTPVDMHIHTLHSDAAISIPSLLTRAKHLGIGVAITDHNEIQGVLEACDHPRDALVIPGRNKPITLTKRTVIKGSGYTGIIVV